MRQTVRNRMKEASGRKVRTKSEDKIDFVIIFRGIEGEPKSLLAPCKDRVTAREVVGDEK